MYIWLYITNIVLSISAIIIGIRAIHLAKDKSDEGNAQNSNYKNMEVERCTQCEKCNKIYQSSTNELVVNCEECRGVKIPIYCGKFKLKNTTQIQNPTLYCNNIPCNIYQI